MVMPFDCYDGVLCVTSGYCGGTEENPSYDEVKSGRTGHLEAVSIVYDEDIIPYSQLLEIYWQQIDPTDDGGQFGDRGKSYRTAVFYHDMMQRETALASLESLTHSGRFSKPIVTQILPATRFYPAEEKHQDYARLQPESYEADSAVQERKAYLKRTWYS